MLTKALKLYESADFLGSKVEPTFNTQSKVKSYLGATFSLILVFLAVLGFGFFGSEIINKKNVRTTLSVMNIYESILQLSDLPILLFFRSEATVLNFNAQFMKAVKLSAQLRIVEAEGINKIKFKIVPIPVVNCVTVKFTAKAEELILETKIDKRAFFCLDFDALNIKEEEKSIRNNYGTENSRSLEILVSKCDQVIDPGCRSYIDTMLPSFFLSATVPNYQIDISNYEKPAKFNSKILNSKINKDFSNTQVVSMDYFEVLTDVGWLVESIVTEKLFTLGKSEFSYGLYQESNKVLLELKIDTPNVRNKIARSYVKVQEVIANVGGFMKALMMFSNLILSDYSNYILLNKIKNDLENNEVKLNIKENPKQNNFVLTKHKESHDKIKIDKAQLGQSGKGTKINRIDFSLWGYLKHLFKNLCNKKKDIELEKYAKYLDIKHTFDEIQRIKEQIEQTRIEL